MRSTAFFSGENLALDDIAYYYTDSERALRAYFTDFVASSDPRLEGYSHSEILGIRRRELDSATALTILAAIEAALRVDYIDRVKTRKPKDDLTRRFRDIYKEKERRASLEDDILEAWREYGGANPQLIENIKGALKYRHWLAHGRYWVPKLPRKYEYRTVYVLAEGVFDLLGQASN